MLAVIMLVAAIAARAQLPEGSTVDLSVIPRESCDEWARNVEQVIQSTRPTLSLNLWASQYPQDAQIIQLTYDYMNASDVMDSDAPQHTALADCVMATRDDAI